MIAFVSTVLLVGLAVFLLLWTLLGLCITGGNSAEKVYVLNTTSVVLLATACVIKHLFM